ncbi:MAG: hypothetical protein CMJ85_11730 [Planctomycetes bacterium]|nr:hypothetical protein [Planctomycetota bacterium]
MYPSILVASLLAVTSVSAQTGRTVYVPGNTPTVGSCNVIPFGTTKNNATWSNQKYQTLLLGSQLGKVPGQIIDIAFAPCGTGDGLYHADRITIKMTMVSISTFVGNLDFATNLGTTRVQTVLQGSNWGWHVSGGKWTRIGLQKSFLYLPTPAAPNLLIEMEFHNIGKTGAVGTGFKRSNTTEYPDRLYAFSWVTMPPATGSTDRAGQKIEVCFDTNDLNMFGQACGSATHLLTGSAKIGNPVNFNLSGAPAVAIWVLGTTVLPTGVPLPNSATNCLLYEIPDILVLPVATSSGAVSIPLKMPPLPALRIYSQFITPVTTGGLESTRYGRVLIGN